MEFLTRQDVARLLGCSLPTVAQIFSRPDFPALIFGKNQLVESQAFAEWCRRRHTKEDYKRGI